MKKSSMKNLTERQREVLVCAASGKTLRQTAEILRVSPHTIKGHRVLVIHNLHAKNMYHAVAIAIRKELIP